MLFIPKTPRIPKQNPKSEARNPKQTETSNPKIEIRNELVWKFVLFDHLDLFRVSDFEFGTYSFVPAPSPRQALWSIE
jgi:hypothetical protein